MAVDYPKSGFLPHCSKDLKIEKYPDFMEKDGTKTYQSTSVLGKLYREAKD